MTDPITITHLEMTDPAELKGRYVSPEELILQRAEIPLPSLSRFFYQHVGRGYYWKRRLIWSDEQWAEWVASDSLQTWVGYQRGTPVGFAEMQIQAAGSVEVLYFGLLPEFIGQGLGGALLTEVLEAAWSIEGTRRVWLHTCSKDHPAALPNYKARGLRVFKTETAKGP